MHSNPSTSEGISKPREIYNNRVVSSNNRITLTSTGASSTNVSASSRSSSKVQTSLLSRNESTTPLSNTVLTTSSSVHKRVTSSPVHNMSLNSAPINEATSSSSNKLSASSSSHSVPTSSSSLRGNIEQNSEPEVVQPPSMRKFFSPGDFFTRFGSVSNTKENTTGESNGSISSKHEVHANINQSSSSRALNSSQSYSASPAIVTSHPYFIAAVPATSPLVTHGGDLQSRISLGPSQKGVINHPGSLTAVPPYLSASSQPHEQAESGGRMAALVLRLSQH